MAVVKRLTQKPETPVFTRENVHALSQSRQEPQWLVDLRKRSWDTYETLPMPSLEDEAWRRTNYSHIDWQQASQQHVLAQANLSAVPRQNLEPLVSDENTALLVFVDGQVVHYSVPNALIEQGVIFKDLNSAVQEHGETVQRYLMTQAVTPADGKFAALNGALWHYGWFVHVPRNVTAEVPMHIVVYNTQNGASLPRALAVTEESANATVVVDYISAKTDKLSAFIGATELLVGNNSKLTYVALQDWNRQTFEFSHQKGRIGRDGNLDWILGVMGSQLTKAFIEIELDGMGANGRVSGFFFADQDQLFDLDTQQNHNAPATTSDLLFKGAGKDQSRTVWQGMIKSLPKMQKIDGFQASRNLLLSDDVRMDGIPGLEIEADDVRCSHAATFGTLEEAPIHYLMSRGIPRNIAEIMLIDGFFDELLQRIPFEKVVERLQAAVEAKIIS